MKPPKQWQVMGIFLGLLVIIAAGLLFRTACSRSILEPPPPLTEAITAPARALGMAYAAVAGHVRPAVVSIRSEKVVRYRQKAGPAPFGDDLFRWFSGESREPRERHWRDYLIPEQGLGSGSILDGKGHILTNYHLVRDVDNIKVTLADKRTFEAGLISTDPKTDVAIIRIKGRVPKDLPTVQLGDSDALQVGDLVLAIGAPFGYVQTVTAGIISAMGRSNVGIADYEDFLQTDAPINPGNSGGPLVNMRGEVIGMNTAIATSVGQFSGVGFAIPVNMLKKLIPVLLKGETVNRGTLGVVIQDLTDDLAREFHLAKAQGALVSQVSAGSPAEQAGIKAGDVIVRFDGKDISDTRMLRNMVAATEPGTKCDIAVMRQGKQQTLTATIGKLLPEKTAAAVPSAPEDDLLSKFGLVIQPLKPELAKKYGYRNAQGVIVAAVADDSQASLSGMQVGDLITEVNHRIITTIEDVRQALAESEEADTVLLLIIHQHASIYVVLRAH